MTFFKRQRYFMFLFLILVCLTICMMFLFGTLGIARISFLESIKILLDKIPFVKNLISSDSYDATHALIILKIRMPRIFLSVLVGAGLSVVGGTFQGMFRNPMADPYVLGISSGAALGATIGIILGLEEAIWGIGLTAFCAFAGAVLTTIIVYGIARVGGRLPASNLLLSGIAVNLLSSSLITIIMIFNREQIEKIIMWMMGSFSASGWKHVAIITPIILAGIIFLTAYSRDLNAMAGGDEAAKNLGVEVETVKKILLIISAVIVAACVSVSGIIGFVGLVIPHIIRLIFGSDHRTVLPFSVVGGAMFMLVSDTLARTAVPPSELPVGAITSLFGVPFFIYLLIKNKKKVFQ